MHSCIYFYVCAVNLLRATLSNAISNLMLNVVHTFSYHFKSIFYSLNFPKNYETLDILTTTLSLFPSLSQFFIFIHSFSKWIGLHSSYHFKQHMIYIRHSFALTHFMIMQNLARSLNDIVPRFHTHLFHMECLYKLFDCNVIISNDAVRLYACVSWWWPLWMRRTENNR